MLTNILHSCYIQFNIVPLRCNFFVTENIFIIFLAHFCHFKKKEGAYETTRHTRVYCIIKRLIMNI
jgi:hypothetical protein